MKNHTTPCIPPINCIIARNLSLSFVLVIVWFWCALCTILSTELVSQIILLFFVRFFSFRLIFYFRFLSFELIVNVNKLQQIPYAYWFVSNKNQLPTKTIRMNAKNFNLIGSPRIKLNIVHHLTNTKKKKKYHKFIFIHPVTSRFSFPNKIIFRNIEFEKI